MIGVIARFSVLEGKEQEFEQLIAGLGEQVRANEPGCLQYDLFKGQEPRAYVLMERYQSQEALGIHSKSAYFRAAMGGLGAVLEGRAAIELLTGV
jgi:quinol monooxygenase YgiN